MDAQETQILSQLLTGVGTVVISSAFAFIGYILKKHMPDFVKWINTNIGEKKFNTLLVFIKSAIAEAEKEGIVNDLDGEAKKAKVVKDIETKYENTLKALNIDSSSLATLVEGLWSSMGAELKQSYEGATKSATQKALEEAQASKEAAAKEQVEAQQAKAQAQATLAQATATQAKLQAAIATVSNATVPNSTAEVATKQDDTKVAPTVAEAKQGVANAENK